MKCTICNRDFSSSNYKLHYNKCKFIYDNASGIITDYTVNLFTIRELELAYNSNFKQLKQFLVDNSIHLRSKSEALKLSTKERHKHTQDTKNKLSEIRKQYLFAHPDEHPWKRNSKFKSVPCETLKSILVDNNISYVEEYSPSGMLYSIDIAFPDKQIGIEINGNQHYNRDGSLKPYYKNRHNVICSSGWKLYEYHYSLVYDTKFTNALINQLKSDFNLGVIDYSFYIKIKDKQPTIKVLKEKLPKLKADKQNYIKKLSRVIHLCSNGCGSIVHKKGDSCRPCFNINRRKVIRPSYEQLQSDVSTMSMVSIGKKYGVSDNAVRKWLTQYQKITIL